MTIPQTLLGLLSTEPQHGYNLKNQFDSLFSHSRSLKFGQVYSTLARLERDGLVHVVATESAVGPERKLYAVTKSGVSEFVNWLNAPLVSNTHVPGELYAKVTLALLAGKDAEVLLEVQKKIYLERLRELVQIRRNGEISEKLAADYESAHLKADLDWIEKAALRLANWSEQLTKRESK